MTDQQEIRQLIGDYLAEGKLLQVSSLGEDSAPRVVNVWYAADDDLAMYFASNVAREHSEDIRSRSKVAGSVVAIQLQGLGSKVRGVTFRGAGTELVGDDLVHGHSVYASRWPAANTLFPLSKMQTGDTPMRIYQVVPTEYVLFDEINFPAQPKQVLNL